MLDAGTEEWIVYRLSRLAVFKENPFGCEPRYAWERWTKNVKGSGENPDEIAVLVADGLTEAVAREMVALAEER